MAHIFAPTQVFYDRDLDRSVHYALLPQVSKMWHRNFSQEETCQHRCMAPRGGDIRGGSPLLIGQAQRLFRPSRVQGVDHRLFATRSGDVRGGPFSLTDHAQRRPEPRQDREHL